MNQPTDTFVRYGLRRNARQKDFLQSGLWQGKRLHEYVDAQILKHPNRPAIIDNLGVVTYSEFSAMVRNLAASLSRLGISRGDIVAIQAPNWRELPVTHLALNRIGAICLPIHDGYREVELSHLLKHSQAKAIIHPAYFREYSHRDLLERIRKDLPDLKHVVVMRADPVEGELGFDQLASDSSRDSSLLDESDTYRCPSTDPLYIMVSSGTTGVPRCSVFCDDAISVKIIRQWGVHSTSMKDHEISAAIAPAGTGTTGYLYPVLGALLHGGTSVMLERWSGVKVGDALHLLEKYKCTYAVVIPTQLVKMVQEAKTSSFDYSSLRFITYAGARLAPAVADEAESIFSCSIQAIYGTSDAGVPTMTSLQDDRSKRRTVGRVVAGQEVKIIDESGTALPQNCIGEICWRGVNSSYGYLNQSSASAADDALDGDWYHSGDLGVFDHYGYLEVVGRKKDMIVRGGRNINPGKIEEILLTHDKVSEVAIIPIADDLLGEIVCAVVSPSRNTPAPTLEELNTIILSAGMPVWYQPEMLELLVELPRNAGGKIDKRKLTETFSPKAAK